jgi:UDP-GlcNAc:undecaprenyl-phosphate/decaprenyl-phosphate GlcNAc-1-phosphate transferase
MINLGKYIIPFLLSFVIAVLVISFFLSIGKKYKRGNYRRFGGAVAILVFWLVVLFNKHLVTTKPILGILTGSFLILIFGLWDDIKSLSWKKQLFFQIIIAVAAIFFGVRSGYISNPFGGAISLENPLIYLPFFILYYLLFINSLNWLDGIDGLSGSVTIVALGTIFFLSFKPEVNQPATAILCAIAGGAVLGFLVHNFKPARIIAGTSGSWFFGFLLASLSIFAGAKIATVMTVSIIPILDLMRVTWERCAAGQSIFQGNDDRHLHFKLLKSGMSERKILFFLALTSLAFGSLALSLDAKGKIILFIAAAVIYIFFISKIKWRKNTN